MRISLAWMVMMKSLGIRWPVLMLSVSAGF